jgi:hypothetical protein
LVVVVAKFYRPSLPAFPDEAAWPGCLTTRCNVWPSSTSTDVIKEKHL